jgi:nicotinate-nucleotide adenylyltransferase
LLDKRNNIERIGIVGGTFNPIHIAHLILSEIFIDDLKLDKCIFVPTYISPLKINKVANIAENPAQRTEMLSIAIKDNPRYSIDNFEILQAGVSYTYRTIHYLMNKYPNSGLFLFIGTDQAINFKKWNHWKDILQNVQICIGDRTNNNIRLKEFISKNLTIEQKEPVWIQNPYLEISSTMIRQRILDGKTIKHLVPTEVENYIHYNNLYKNKSN